MEVELLIKKRVIYEIQTMYDLQYKSEDYQIDINQFDEFLQKSDLLQNH